MTSKLKLFLVPYLNILEILNHYFHLFKNIFIFLFFKFQSNALNI
jgi:hypothetical protein